MNAERTKQALREWLARTSGRVAAADIEDETPLVSQGILKSVHVLELILWIEERLERSIDPERIRPGSFGCIDAIYGSFFGEEDGCAA